jgi:ribosomal protein S18 acetylase RimI-like enzyme
MIFSDRQSTPRPTLMLRPATARDAGAIAALHAAVWHEAYRNLAPQAAIDALTEAHRLRQWQETLSCGDETCVTIVAEMNAAIVGFTQLASPQEPAFGDRREVKYLYVARSQARQGIGRQLLRHLVTIALQSGAQGMGPQGMDHQGIEPQGMGLGVVVGNDPAISFYQAMGACLVGRYQDPGPLWRSDNLLYAWDGLAALNALVASGS